MSLDRRTFDELTEAFQQKVDDFKSSYLEPRFVTIEKQVKALDQLKTELDEQLASQVPGATKIGQSPGRGLSANRRKDLSQYIRTGKHNGLSNLETKELALGQGPEDGGNLFSEDLDNEIQKQLKGLAPFRQYARVVGTDSNQYSKIVSSGGGAVARAKESDARNATATPKVNKVIVSLFEMYGYPSLTQEMGQSTAFDVIEWLISELTEGFAEHETTEVLTGDPANGEMQGILTMPMAATSDASRAFGTIQSVTTAGSGVVAADDLMKLLHSLKAGYRANSVFVMNSQTVEAVRLLKDAADAYIWRPGLEFDAPSTLLGRPVLEVEQMPALAGGSMPVLLADLDRGYVIADNERGSRLLRDEITQPGHIKFYYSRFTGGSPVDTSAIKVLSVKS